MFSYLKFLQYFLHFCKYGFCSVLGKLITKENKSSQLWTQKTLVFVHVKLAKK